MNTMLRAFSLKRQVDGGLQGLALPISVSKWKSVHARKLSPELGHHPHHSDPCGAGSADGAAGDQRQTIPGSGLIGPFGGESERHRKQAGSFGCVSGDESLSNAGNRETPGHSTRRDWISTKKSPIHRTSRGWGIGRVTAEKAATVRAWNRLLPATQDQGERSETEDRRR